MNAAPASLAELSELLYRSPDFDAVLSALDQGRSATVDGAWASSSALVAAAVARRSPRPVLVVIAHPRDLDAWAADLHGFSGIEPAILPAWDNTPGTGPIDDVAGQRLRLLRRLESDDPPPLILATFPALIQPVPDRASLSQGRRIVKVGDTLDLDEFARWLVERGYQPAEAVELPGEFSRRGGIFDVYSPDADAPA